MAEKKKAYRRWVELTEQATAPLAAEAEGRDSTKLRRPRVSLASLMGPPDGQCDGTTCLGSPASAW